MSSTVTKDSSQKESCSPEPLCGGSPASPNGSVNSSASSNEDVVDDKDRLTSSGEQEELIPIPPPVPKNGISILAHKLWIGNLDKRLNE